MATDIGIDDRRTRISELLAVKGYMSLTELVRALGVSESTVRRDLEVLEEQGPLRRTHGGAVYVKDGADEVRKRGLLVSEIVIPRPSKELFSEYI